MILQPNFPRRLLLRYGTVMTASALTLVAPTIARSASVVPFDEPPCYMRMQDGRVVNLQSLCRRSPIAPVQPTTNQQPAAPLKRPVLQGTPKQVSHPVKTPDPSGSHARGNPDSDDGNY